MNLPGTPITSDDQRIILDPRWIDGSTAGRAILRRVDSPTGGQLIGRNGAGNYEGIVIGFQWPGEPHVRDWVLRRDHPEYEQKADGTNKPRGKYLYPPGRGNLLFIPPDADPALLADVSVPIWITEGPLKCLALWRAAWHGLGDSAEKPRALPVAINGVWGFRGTVGKDFDADGARVGVKGVISDFARIELRDRSAVIIFDSDLELKASVRVAERGLTRELQERGASVRLFRYPKDRPKDAKGIDDFLAVRGPEETLKVIAFAKMQRAKTKSGAVAAPIANGPRPLTELGNAERLVKANGVSFRYCGPLKSFLVHDGKRWINDEVGQMERWAKATVREIYKEAAAQEDSAVRTSTAEWAKRSEKAAQISAMLRLAQSEAGVPIMSRELDAGPWLLNVENGTLDLRTGTLRSHRSQDLITKLAPVKYDAAAKCPHFRQFLSEVFEPHPDAIKFIQAYAGYSLTADTREECLAILYGTGRNGKSTLLKVLSTLLGEYAGTADFSTFVTVRDDRGPRDDIANMRGRRLISAQEGRDGASLAESIIKWLTGGDRIRARKLNENSYEFDPTWKIWLASNYKPIVKGTDSAIWSRIRLVPFDVSFEGREDKTLKARLVDELPGILNWTLEGCLRWQSEGLPLPESVAQATGEYRSESDTFARFIGDRCVVDKGLSVQAHRLYTAYREWADETGERDTMSETAFGRRLTESGFEKKHTNKGNFYCGIGLAMEK